MLAGLSSAERPHREVGDMTEETFRVCAIGHVANRFHQPGNAEEARSQESRIVLQRQYVDGLYKIEEHKHLDVIFYFHKSAPIDISQQRVREGTRGVFASRSPVRPAPLGLTTVELLNVEGNELVVRGLDALNGTSVLDIKPHVKGPEHLQRRAVVGRDG